MGMTLPQLRALDRQLADDLWTIHVFERDISAAGAQPEAQEG